LKRNHQISNDDNFVNNKDRKVYKKMKIKLEISTLKLGFPKCCEITFLKTTNDKKRDHAKLKNNNLSLP